MNAVAEDLLERGLKPTRLIRTYVNPESDGQPSPAKGKSRFLEPYSFEEKGLKAISAVLDKHRLGDDEGRRVFLIAVEYEIASLVEIAGNDMAPPAKAAIAISDTADRIAAHARELARLLPHLNPAESAELGRTLGKQDTFRREYGQPYFDALLEQMNHLGQACESITPQPQANKLSEDASRRFADMMQDAFSDCFETDPTADPKGPFVQLLNTVTELAGLPLRYSPSLIEQVILAARD